MADQQVEVGFAAIIVHDNKMLLGRRKGSHGDGMLAFPGGRLEYGETWEAGLAREVREETGLRAQLVPYSKYNTAFWVTNEIWPNRHFVTLWLKAVLVPDDDGLFRSTPQILEPDKCASWGWFSYAELHQELLQAWNDWLYRKDNPQLLWVPFDQLTMFAEELGI